MLFYLVSWVCIILVAGMAIRWLLARSSYKVGNAIKTGAILLSCLLLFWMILTGYIFIFLLFLPLIFLASRKKFFSSFKKSSSDYRTYEFYKRYTGSDNDPFQAPPSSLDTDMPPQEALRVLGLRSHASKGEILRAHKRLMMQNHPDKGGNVNKAARINRARDILLKLHRK